MAEINQSAGSSSHVRIRSKKLSTHIDMTPMVDLAFLLLTFFILTTTLNKLKVMEIGMPEKTPETTPIPEKRVLTLLIDGNDKVYWRQGISVPKLESVKFSHDPINKLLTLKDKEIDKMLVLVKATNKSKYKNLVDIVDELAIAKIDSYCIVDVTAEDEELIKATLK
ncbi:MAG TPA: biopolymer transporter ExbD [Cyclobacteriaceae bacterium]|jgi:biopolymer transport protein ExbD|nr:biopolymer transporter ExbD [Cyclobacteriaceae bacterium]